MCLWTGSFASLTWRDEVADPALVVELARSCRRARSSMKHDAQAARSGTPSRAGAGRASRRRTRSPRRSRRRAGTRSSCRSPSACPTTSISVVRLAARELLPVDLPVAAHLGDEPLRERVDDRDADAVQAARDLVALAAELAAGVELRQDDRERGQALLGASCRPGSRAPSSRTVTELSGWSVTSTRSLRPASASSTALSTTS